MTVARKRKPFSRASRPKIDKISPGPTASSKSGIWPGEERRSEGRFEALLFDISARFIALPVDRIADEILRAQQAVRNLF